MVQPSSNLTSQDSYFNWICYATAAVFGVAVLALIYDLKSEVTVSLDSAQMAITEANQAIGIVNEKLPDIVAAVNRGSETLSGLAEDVELIKSVAGIRGDQTDQGFRSLLNYADEIQKVLAQEGADKGAVILVEEIFGTDLKQVETVDEFIVGLSKEMVGIILPLSKSKQEILYRTSHSAPPRRKPFFIQFPETDPVSVEAFIKKHHSETRALPDYEPN
jgi:hypothetical protein